MKLKIILPLCSLLLMINVLHAGYSSLEDYKFIPSDTIRIGEQVWMKNNLNIPMPKSFWYENDSIANRGAGRLYFSSSAMAACPRGWHLPSDDEWQQMINFLGGDSTALANLLPGGKTGMNLTYGGYRSANSSNDLFGKKGEQGFYWTSTVKGEQTAYARVLTVGSFAIDGIAFRRANAFSVRFIKD